MVDIALSLDYGMLGCFWINKVLIPKKWLPYFNDQLLNCSFDGYHKSVISVLKSFIKLLEVIGFIK